MPEAERYISRYRDRYDPSARRNVPAHVTVLYPFMPPDHIDAHVIDALRGIAQSVPCFSYRMAETRRFPVALYLAPDPDEPYIALINAVNHAFPEYPPFEGKFPDRRAAHHRGARRRGAAVRDRSRIAHCAARDRCAGAVFELVLIENASGRWEQMQAFPLG